MHPEIEKLIDLALADGQITEKERNVILKKAAEFGVDADEVEMTLDGKLHQLEASKTKQKEKVGNIKTCPACGASAKAMELVCSECSHEFTNTKANSTLLKLLEEIEKINNKEILSPQILKGALGDLAQKNTIDLERNKLKSELIENFPIPNSREDILEFLAFSVSKAKDNSYISYFGDGYSTSGAWRKKADEIIIKSKIMFKNDTSFYNQILAYENDSKTSLKSRNRMRNVIIAIIAIILIIVYGGIMLSQILKK
jgi:hypothetical protein